LIQGKHVTTKKFAFVGKLTRLQRVIIVLAIAWFLFASGVYYSALNGYQHPGWINLWRNVFPFYGDIAIFEADCSFGTGADWWQTGACTFSFSMLGYLVFIFYPMIIIGFGVFAVRWTLFGSSNSPSPRS
jgi:hypothetical protein